MNGRIVKKSGKDNSPKSILLVEDSRVNRLVIERLLHCWGYSVKSASSGLSALRLAAQESFDLVLMNLQMPGMSGRETARLLRRLNIHYQLAPIVAFSANAEQLLQCREPFTDFFEVPYVPEHVKNLLELHLPQTTALQESTPIGDRLEVMSGGDVLYQRQLISLFIKNCSEILEDLQMGRLESPAYLSQVRHKHKSSLRLLELFSLEAALDNLQEVLQYEKVDTSLLELRKQMVAQQAGAVIEEFSLIPV